MADGYKNYEQDVNDLENIIEEKLALIEDALSSLELEGFNVGLILHYYDPLTKESFFNTMHTGDPYALSGCMQSINNNGGF